MIDIDDEYEHIDEYEDNSIQSIIPNQDHSILSVIRKDKVNFYDTSNCKEYADNLGDSLSNISICLPYHRSQIVFIVGNKGNIEFPYDTIVLYNLELKTRLADIRLNLNNDEYNQESIEKLYATTRNLFVILTHKIILFNILTLEYITTFEDVKAKKGSVSFNTKNDINLMPETTLAYISNLNNTNIKIIKLKYKHSTHINDYNKDKNYYDEHGDTLVMSQQLLSTDLEGNQFIAISSHCKFIAVVSLNGEKINIYSLRTYKARKYLWRGKTKVSIVDVVFDPHDLFMCLFSLQKTFHFYPLLNKYLNSKAKTELNMEGAEEQDYYLYGVHRPRRPMNGKGQHGGKRQYKDSHAQFKDKSVLKDEIMLFYLNEKSDLLVYNKKGSVFNIKMNKKNGGLCTLTQTKHLSSSDYD